jgi:hypothetical protein
MVSSGNGFVVAIDENYKLIGYYDSSVASAQIQSDINTINMLYTSDDDAIYAEYVSAGPDFFAIKTINGYCEVYGSTYSSSLVPPSGIKFVTFSCGFDFIVAITDTGSLYAWGNDSSINNNVPSGLFTSVSCGSSHALAIDVDGSVYAWGDNSFNQSNVPSGLKAVDISAGSKFSFAIDSDFKVVYWGEIDFQYNSGTIPTFACSVWCRNDTVIIGGFANEWNLYTDLSTHKYQAFLYYLLEHPIRYRSNSDIWAPGPVIDLFRIYDSSASKETDLNRYCRLLGEKNDICSDDFKINDPLILSQIPVSVSGNSLSKNIDAKRFEEDRIGLCYQSNIKNYRSDIYYRGYLNHFSIFGKNYYLSEKIQNQTYSFEPSIGSDYYGNAVVAWRSQNNVSSKENNYIYSSFISNESSDINKCLLDEMLYKLKDFFIYDPYDPYSFKISPQVCEVEFIFRAPSSNTFNFFVDFYYDYEFKNKAYSYSSSVDPSAWSVDGINAYADGHYAQAGDQLYVRFNASGIEELYNKVLFVKIGFNSQSSSLKHGLVNQNNNNIKDPLTISSDISGNNPNLNSSSKIWVMAESLSSDLNLPKQEFINYKSEDGILRFNSFGKTLLEGVSSGETTKSFYVHIQKGSGNSEFSDFVLSFGGIVSYVAFTKEDLDISSLYSIDENVTYPQSNSSISNGLVDGEFINIDQSGRKIIFRIKTKQNGLRSLRVVVKENKFVSGNFRSVFLCNSKGAGKCVTQIPFINKTSNSSLFKIKMDIYSDEDCLNYIGSFDSSVNNNCFTNGIIGYYQCPPKNIIYVNFIPPVMEYINMSGFEISNSSIISSETQELISENISRKYLQPDIKYHFKAYAVFDGGNSTFIVKSNFKCDSKLKSDVEYTSPILVSSGKNVLNNNLEICSLPGGESVLSWSDTRFNKERNTSLSFSSSQFSRMFATVDISGQFVNSSSQGGYDRQFKFVSGDTEQLFISEYKFIADSLGNFSSIGRSGDRILSSHMSLGTQRVPRAFVPIYNEGNGRTFFDQSNKFETITNYDEFRRIRVVKDFVDYFSTISEDIIYPVVSDCFVHLDIIGVPGTQAVRIKNENDQEFSSWLHIQEPDSVYIQNKSQPEKDFISEFSPFFVERERFVVPWVLSSGNGIKKVCIQILTAFGVTNTFCIDIVVNYKKLEYEVEFYYGVDDAPGSSSSSSSSGIFRIPSSVYRKYPILNNKTIYDPETGTRIIENDLRSLNINETYSISKIIAVVIFKDKNRVERISNLMKYPFFSSRSNGQVIAAKLYQQGIETIDVPLNKISNGIYEGEFEIKQSDGIAYIDGLASLQITVPGECFMPNIFDLFSEFRQYRFTNLNTDIKIVNYANYILDFYNKDDIKNSFGSSDYYSSNLNSLRKKSER